jgi:hypothetical protein
MGCSHAPPSLLATSESPDMFEPGAEWRDTNGDRIEAHGGGILTIGGTSYLVRREPQARRRQQDRHFSLFLH